MDIKYNVDELFLVTFIIDFNGVSVSRSYICKNRYNELIDIFTNEKFKAHECKIERLEHYYSVLSFKNNKLLQTKEELQTKLYNINLLNLLEDINFEDHLNILDELGLLENSKINEEITLKKKI